MSDDRPSAREIIAALNGKWNTDHGYALCPAHEDTQNPSLKVTQAGTQVLVHCHAGCSQDEVIDALRARRLWPAVDERQQVRIDPAVAHQREVARTQAHARQVMAEFFKRRGAKDGERPGTRRGDENPALASERTEACGKAAKVGRRL